MDKDAFMTVLNDALKDKAQARCSVLFDLFESTEARVQFEGTTQRQRQIFEVFTLTQGFVDLTLQLTPDAVMVADMHGMLAMNIIKSRIKVPYIYDAHELTLRQLPYELNAEQYMRIIEEECIKNAFCFYTISACFADIYAYEYKLEKKPLYFYNLPTFSENEIQKSSKEIRQKLGLDPEKRILLYHGVFLPKKRNLERLVRVSNMLSEHNIHVLLLSSIHGLSDLDKPFAHFPNITWHPPVSQKELPLWIRVADMVILPDVGAYNYLFCSPNRFFDALSMKKPVLVNEEILSLTSIINTFKNGYTGSMQTDEAMLQTIVEAFDALEKGCYTKDNIEKAAKLFSFEKQKIRFHDMIEKLEAHIEGKPDNDFQEETRENVLAPFLKKLINSGSPKAKEAQRILNEL
ncbi:MAG: hypothetical protein KAJ75_06440 [Alphaproteobacteria bacterium]|nr:hypothetical protein [Alphaproteobacteria bacterium]